MDLYIKDNYGHAWEAGDAKNNNYLYGVTFSATSVAGSGSVAVNSNGDITIVGTVTNFDLTAYANGKSVTTSITVQ